MGNLLYGAKVGDIAITNLGAQMFYIHNIIGDTMVMSGISVRGDSFHGIFHKATYWQVHSIAPDDERSKFFETIKRYGFKIKFDVNNGVQYVDGI